MPFIRIMAAAVGSCVSLGAAAQQMGHEMHGVMSAPMGSGLYGPYAMPRDASGTSWQPDSTAMSMSHSMLGEWSLMSMATVNAVYTDSSAYDHGGSKSFVSSMGMLSAQRATETGTVGLRAMLSLDPLLMGKQGYPLLFQTGETADGVTPLVDRQHPHDLFMELAASYSRNLGERESVFIYAGLPGEPALGPVTYMHRGSGMDNPETPLGHHWFDSTHVTFGVVTAGVVLRNLKLEASAFNGREPDEYRYDIEIRPLDSWSARASWNPSRNWSTQLSFGHLREPEKLEPQVDLDRTTASVTYNLPLPQGGWQTTLAVARNAKHPGRSTAAYLLESALPVHKGLTVFARAERVEKDELFEEASPLHGQVFTVDKFSAGAVREFADTGQAHWGIGAAYSRHFIPYALRPEYGKSPDSWLVFLRLRFE